MGTILKGVLGGFSGTVGTVIGGSWKGREYMRSQPGPRKKAPSPKQLVTEAKFATVARFLSAFGSLMKFSFKTELSKLSSRNIAHRTIYQNALTGAYPNFVIDCTKVQISNGILAKVRAPKAHAAENAQINFSWSDNSGTEGALSDDQALLVLYSPDQKLGGYAPVSGARSAGAAVLDARDFAGHTVHTWIAMVKADGTQISPSVYTGEISVTDEIIAPVSGSAKH